jgi:4'-phosphopantetheinyl transferase
MVAIAAGPVGVDIEALPSRETVEEVSGLLHPAERSEILGAPASEQAELFARLWTRKEAYLKAVGVGLAHDFATSYLASAETAAGPPGWSVFNVDAPRGYAAAAAVRDS